MNEAAFTQWRSTRSMGRLRFLLLHGVSKFGSAMTLLIVILTKPYVDGLMTPKVFLCVVLGLAMGLVYGIIVWTLNEQMFRRSRRVR